MANIRLVSFGAIPMASFLLLSRLRSQVGRYLGGLLAQRLSGSAATSAPSAPSAPSTPTAPSSLSAPSAPSAPSPRHPRHPRRPRLPGRPRCSRRLRHPGRPRCSCRSSRHPRCPCHASSSLRNKRPDLLSGRPPCMGVAIGSDKRHVVVSCATVQADHEILHPRWFGRFRTPPNPGAARDAPRTSREPRTRVTACHFFLYTRTVLRYCRFCAVYRGSLGTAVPMQISEPALAAVLVRVYKRETQQAEGIHLEPVQRLVAVRSGASPRPRARRGARR